MRKSFAVTMIMVLLMLPATQLCRAEVTVGATIGDEGLKEFHLAIGKQYNYPEKEVVTIRDKHIPEEELPVVFFLARRAQVSPMTIVKLRLGGQSWIDISLHYGLSPDVFFVPVQVDPGPPYGRAYGYYRDRDKHHWKTVQLEDGDIVNLVNLRFMADRYGCSPDEIIKRRGQGQDFVKIHGEVKGMKDHKGKSSSANPVAANDHGKDKGKDNGKGKGHKK